MCVYFCVFFFFQAEDGIRDFCLSRGLGDVYKRQATGILFGNKADVPEDELSPSLKVVKEAAVNFEVPHNSIIFDQTLESWARQGILMINSALTVEMNKVGSHTMLWRPFISSLLKNISETNPGLIYVSVSYTHLTLPTNREV